MIIIGVKKNKLFKLTLPENIEGNYLIKDNLGSTLATIEAEESKWVIYPNEGYSLIFNNAQVSKSNIEEYSQFYLKNTIDGSISFLVSTPTVESNIIELKPKKSKIIIGSSKSCDICYQSELLKQTHATIIHENLKWYIECENQCYIFVDERLAKRKRLGHGDTIYLYGLKVICLCDFIILINCAKSIPLVIKEENFEKRNIVKQEIKSDAIKMQGEYETFAPEDLFLRSPRFKTSITHQQIEIAPPPSKQNQPVSPSILTIGPQLTMLLTSSIGMFTTFTAIANGSQTMASSLPSLLVTVITLVSSLFWPSVTRKWNKRNMKKQELIRVRSYRKYLDKKDKEITNIISNQKQILLENNVTLEMCQQIIYQRKRNLWEKTIEDDDFLTARIGVGFVKPDIEITYQDEEFSMDDDKLKDELRNLIKKYDYVEEAPLNFSFLKNRISAIVGNYSILQLFFESIL